MTDILFYGILIIIALGILSFLFRALLGWLSMILEFLFGLIRFVWRVVTLPFAIFKWIARLDKSKKDVSQ